jgi:pimeloyl-ACP methyl ester carboxylesterase
MIFLVQQQPAFVKTGASGFDAKRAGETDKTVVFIHGAGNDHRVWDAQLAALGSVGSLNDASMEEHNLLAVDLPGHGRSFAAAKQSIEDYADWIINLLDNGGIRCATLVGHSMGSLIALDCARRFASRVASLVLVGTSVPMPVADKVLDTARDDVESAYDMIIKASFFVPRNADGSWPPPTPAMRTQRAALSENREGVPHTDLQACNAYSVSPAALGNIETRTTIVIAAQDRMTPPAAGEAVAAALPNANARKVFVDQAGHMMQIEAPDAVNRALIDALGGKRR